MQHRDDTIILVTCIDDPVAMPPPIKQVAKLTAFGKKRASARVFVETQDSLFKSVESYANLPYVHAIDGLVNPFEVPGCPLC